MEAGRRLESGLSGTERLWAPYSGARWNTPRYNNGLFFQGYWEGDRGQFEHNHRWDRDRDRDRRWERDHDRDRDRYRDRR